MTTTAEDLVIAAYNRNTGNDPGKLAVDAELIAHLDRSVQRVWALVARTRPDQFATTATVTLAGSPPSATLPADLIDILAVSTSDGTPVTLIPVTERAKSWHLPPAVYRRGATLISRNLGTGDPTVGAMLTLDLLDAPARLTTLSSLLDARWPARHLQLLVDLLAVYLSTKDAGRPAPEHAKLVAELRQSAGAFAAEYQLPPSALEWLHAPAERTPAGAA